MTAESRTRSSDEVSPLELFFDLVFVFALSQLSHHLLDHLTARGAAETVVMLVGVFCVWSYTSFEATALSLTRSYTRWMLLGVMGIGLFMNAAIPHAFADRAWAFVIPLLAIQIGRPLLTGALVPQQVLRGHYRVILVWMLATAPLWIAGAAAPPDARLTWWLVAAVIDLVGTWWAHPLPGRVLASHSLAFDAGRPARRPTHRPAVLGQQGHPRRTRPRARVPAAPARPGLDRADQAREGLRPHPAAVRGGRGVPRDGRTPHHQGAAPTLSHR